MMRFLYPEFVLVAIPLYYLYARFLRAPGITGWLRVLALGLLVLTLMGPEVNFAGRGIDIVVVADRSRSLPTGSNERVRELIQNLQKSRRWGDRVGIITFGSGPAVESVLLEQSSLGEFTREILPDGSDLNAALHAALDLLKNPYRPGRVLVLSDGEANGPSPVSAARRAREMGIPVDFREFSRQRVGDVAVDAVVLPEQVRQREPFQYAVWIHSEREVAAGVTVQRGNDVVSKDTRQLHPGMNRLLFRDLLEEGGLVNYSVKLELDGDPLPENNVGTGVVRVESPPSVLVLNAAGKENNFVRALRAGRMLVEVQPAGSYPLTPGHLERFRAVILENIPAADLGRQRMERLAQFVEDLGGGLMLTGGEQSFGTGGYFRSPLDPVLPVSMEIREEHRKTRIALAIALDRSGSMAVPVAGGKVKMDLANLGAAECVRMLSAGDSVAIIAVDSAPHVIQPLTPVTDPEAIARKSLKIQSMGGGIFVYEALVAAGAQIKGAEQSTKHIILFSDANDSEEPGDYKTLLRKFEAAGITVSVIGLGKPTDVDSALLKDIARLGRGNIMFSEDAQELPRLFTQDTMSVARSSFVTKDEKTQPNGIGAAVLPQSKLIGEIPSGSFPNVEGYNLSYLKKDATLGVVSTDEYNAPLAAFWYRGLGRVAAVTMEVDGKHTGRFGTWDNYADFLITHARWLVGGDDPEAAFVKLSREGQEAVVSLEIDPDRAAKVSVDTPTLKVVVPSVDREGAIDVPFQWRGPNSLQARFKLNREGTYRTLVQLGPKEFVRVPAITLPYSPEFMPRIGLPSGRETLTAISELSQGKERVDVVSVFNERMTARRAEPLLPWLLGLTLLVLLAEIAGRRLSLWTKIEEYALPEGVPVPLAAAASGAGSLVQTVWQATLGPLFGDKPAPRSRGAQHAATPRGNASTTTTTASNSSGTAPTSPTGSLAPETATTAPSPAATTNIFDQAKRRARKRLQD